MSLSSSACSAAKKPKKLREKTARQSREADERISILQEEMAGELGELHDPVLTQPLRQSSARKSLPASLSRETRMCRRQKQPVRHAAEHSARWGGDVSEQQGLISSDFPGHVSKPFQASSD